MKRLMLLLAALLLVCFGAQAEMVTDNDDGTTPTDLMPELTRRDSLVDLTIDPFAEWEFQPDVPILEIVIPQVTMADAAILRIDGHVMMIDAGGATEEEAVRQALTWMGVTEVETAICTHPHHDHMPGFAIIADQVKIDRLLIPFGAGSSMVMDQELAKLAALNIPVMPIRSGEVLTIADAGEKIEAIQVAYTGASVNNRSLICRITYGYRSMLLTADIEKETQKRLVNDPPVCGLSADILKYPHHGLARMQNALVELIRPRLAIITNEPGYRAAGAARLAEYFVPALYSSQSAIRLRTDGVIWVVDRLTGPEK